MEEKLLHEYVSEVREINDIVEYMKDPVVDEAMGYLVKLTVKEHVPPAQLAPLIVKLQSLAGLCHQKAKYYTLYDKGAENAKRKNTYYSVEESLDKLVNALKYMSKGYNG